YRRLLCGACPASRRIIVCRHSRGRIGEPLCFCGNWLIRLYENLISIGLLILPKYKTYPSPRLFLLRELPCLLCVWATPPLISSKIPLSEKSVSMITWAIAGGFCFRIPPTSPLSAPPNWATPLLWRASSPN